MVSYYLAPIPHLAVSSDGPRPDERDRPGNWTWPEGSHQTLTCQARGNPTPKLICRREGDGALLPTGDLGPVKREITGTYQCQATSSRGVATRAVVVNAIRDGQGSGLGRAGPVRPA